VGSLAALSAVKSGCSGGKVMANESGPYIVSTLNPLSGGLPTNAHYLFQNLSSRVVPDTLAQGWITRFQSQVTSKEFWNESVAESLIYTLREEVAVLAKDIPEAEKALATWIEWITPESKH
jgi:hypothetical protein